MSLKLNISKAYEIVKWNFLETVIGKMDFDDKWIKFIMLYVKTVTYLVLINDEPKGWIT